MARFPFNPAEIHIGMNHRGTQYEIELRYVCLTDFAAIVIEPAEYAGGWILSAHIPPFGFPTRHGFAYGCKITWWMMDEIRSRIEHGQIQMDFDSSKLKPWWV